MEYIKKRLLYREEIIKVRTTIKKFFKDNKGIEIDRKTIDAFMKNIELEPSRIIFKHIIQGTWANLDIYLKCEKKSLLYPDDKTRDKWDEKVNALICHKEQFEALVERKCNHLLFLIRSKNNYKLFLFIF